MNQNVHPELSLIEIKLQDFPFETNFLVQGHTKQLCNFNMISQTLALIKFLMNSLYLRKSMLREDKNVYKGIALFSEILS